MSDTSTSRSHASIGPVEHKIKTDQSQLAKGIRSVSFNESAHRKRVDIRHT